MKKSSTAIVVPHLRLVLTTAQPGPDGIPMTEEDVRKMAPIAACIKALLELLPKDVTGQLCLVGGEIRLNLSRSPSAEPDVTAESVVDQVVKVVHGLHRNAAELKSNAAMPRPLPNAEAVKEPATLVALRALQKANASSGLELAFVTPQAVEPLPVPMADDFSGGGGGRPTSKTDTYLIVGLRRDDHRGHQLIVTSEDLYVRLPVNEKWDWSHIRNVLNEETWLEGTLVRKGVREEWSVGDDACIRRQEDAFA